MVFQNLKNNLHFEGNNFKVIFIFSLLIYLWPLIPTGSFTNNYNSVMFWYLLGMTCELNQNDNFFNSASIISSTNFLL